MPKDWGRDGNRADNSDGSSSDDEAGHSKDWGRSAFENDLAGVRRPQVEKQKSVDLMGITNVTQQIVAPSQPVVVLNLPYDTAGGAGGKIGMTVCKQSIRKGLKIPNITGDSWEYLLVQLRLLKKVNEDDVEIAHLQTCAADGFTREVAVDGAELAKLADACGKQRRRSDTDTEWLEALLDLVRVETKEEHEAQVANSSNSAHKNSIQILPAMLGICCICGCAPTNKKQQQQTTRACTDCHKLYCGNCKYKYMQKYGAHYTKCKDCAKEDSHTCSACRKPVDFKKSFIHPCGRQCPRCRKAYCGSCKKTSMVKHEGHYDICRTCSRAPKAKISKETDWGAIQADARMAHQAEARPPGKPVVGRFDAFAFAKAKAGGGPNHRHGPQPPAALPPPSVQ
jgi:hypothetical protein